MEILAAIVLAKWGGDLASSRDHYLTAPAEKAIGWAFLIAGVSVAVRAGMHL